MTRYLLSTGRSTTAIEKYILDLFKLNIQIYPGDIPGSNVGFDFTMSNVKKDELGTEIRSRISTLVSRMKKQFEGVEISIGSLELLDEERVLVNINVNDYSDSISIDL